MSDSKYYKQGTTKAVCPYFIREGVRTITCEGFTNDAKSVQCFRTPAQKLEYQREHCFCFNAECVIRRRNDERFA